MPPYRVVNTSKEAVLGYDTFDEAFELPVNIVNVAVVDTENNRVIWDRDVANRFLRTGWLRERSFAKRVTRAVSAARLLTTVLNNEEI